MEIKNDRNVLKVFLSVCHIPIVAIMNDKNVMKRIIFGSFRVLIVLVYCYVIFCKDTIFSLLLSSFIKKITTFAVYY